jgi:hypothetical protein
MVKTYLFFFFLFVTRKWRERERERYFIQFSCVSENFDMLIDAVFCNENRSMSVNIW